MVATHSKNKVIYFSILIFLNILIRIPSIPHEKGSDSFFIHLIANSLTYFGQANWWINLYSVFGMYPNSYASAVPFMLSGISQTTAINMEYIILLTSIILGVISIFTSYLLGEVLFPNTIYKYILSLIYPLSQGILIFTTWEMSTRGVYLVFFPLCFYLVISSLNNHNYKKLILSIVLLLFLFAVHKFAYIALAIFALTYIFYILFDKFILIRNLPSITYVSFLLISILLPFFKRSLISYGSKYDWIWQVALIEIRYVGPLFFLIAGGAIYLIFKRNKVKNETLIIMLSILLVPILYSQTYGHFIYLPLSLVLLSIGLLNVISIPRKYASICVIFMVLMFVTFSGFYNHWRTGDNQDEWYLKEDVYSSALWANSHFSENAVVIGNSDITMKRFEAISNCTPKVLNEDIMATIYGYIDVSNYPMIENSPSSLSYYFDSPFVLESGYSFNGKINWIFAQNDIDYPGAKQLINNYSISNFVIDTEVNVPSFSSISNNKNCIYDNKKIKIYTTY